MLVLSRCLSERIFIKVGGTNLVLTVVNIDRNKIRVGIDAPKEVEILREEVFIRAKGHQAAEQFCSKAGAFLTMPTPDTENPGPD